MTLRLRVHPEAEAEFLDAVRDDELLIVAFAHQSRRPGYWMQCVSL